MASAEELRQQIAAARAAFREALGTVDGKWEQAPADEEWPPKQIALHAIGSEIYFANFVSKAMLGKPPEFERAEVASPEEALSRHEAAAAAADRSFKYVEDRDLDKVAEGIPGTEDQTIRGAMSRAAAHLQEHADQLRLITG